RGRRALVARCYLGLGQLYQRAGRPGDAAPSLKVAASLLTELGMRWWQRQVEAGLAGSGCRGPLLDRPGAEMRYLEAPTPGQILKAQPADHGHQAIQGPPESACRPGAARHGRRTTDA